MVITMAKLRMAHASTHGARKPPGPKIEIAYIFLCYAKILGETNFQLREIPLSGSKAKDVKEKEKRRTKVGNNNGQLRIATPPRVAQTSCLSQHPSILKFPNC